MSRDPETGIRPISEWGAECGRGFVSNARFGTGQVIQRTNRKTTRKWRGGSGANGNSREIPPTDPEAEKIVKPQQEELESEE